MRFELHCHSTYSHGTKIPVEGTMAPSDVIRIAKRRGLDGIALTDHRTNKGWEEAEKEAKRQGIAFIPGIEIATLSGHLIGLGLNEFIPSDLGLDETIERIRGQGALAVAPHPFDVKGDGIGNMIESTDAVEVFNSLSIDKVSNWYAERSARKTGKPRVVGSDAHMPEHMGLAVNIMDANDADSVLREIRRGRVLFEKGYADIGMSMRWVRERMTRSYPEILRYIDGHYFPAKAWTARALLYKFVHSKNPFNIAMWRLFAETGLIVSRVYSLIRIMKYI